VYLTPPLGSPLKLGNNGWLQETRTIVLPWRIKKFDDIFSYWVQCTNVKDRLTDTGRQLIPRLRTVSRGNHNVLRVIAFE